MAYEIISQNNNTTTLSDGTNTITVPGHVTLATSTSYTITEVNNNTATLEGGDGSVIRDVPCIAVLAGGGSSDTHNKGFFATQAALEEAYPTGEAGDYAIVGATDTVWIWDEDSSAWVDTDTKGQVESVNAKTGTVVLTAIDVSAVPEYSAMPVASADTANQIVLYSGATNGTYTHGYFYANKVSITESSATASQTTGNSLSDVAVNKLTFETQITETGNYKFIFDGTNWTYDDEPVNVADYGITFTGTPIADDVITVVYGARVYLYYWEQINVQPSVDPLPSQSGNSGKFLTTNGTSASWANVDTLPSQTGQSGKFLTTDGTDASWANAVANWAQGTDSFVIGYDSNYVYDRSGTVRNTIINGNCGYSVKEGVAIGVGAVINNQWNVAIGRGAKTSGNYSIAIGGQAYTNGAYAIQLGYNRTNSDANTFKVANENGNFELMSADGTIPTDRFTTTPSADGTYVPTLTISSGTATRTWGAAASAPVVPATMPTLAVADWSSNTQTVSVQGVTGSNIVIVAPVPTDTQAWADAGIVCVSQGTNSLTFECQTVPSTAISVNVVIFN